MDDLFYTNEFGGRFDERNYADNPVFAVQQLTKAAIMLWNHQKQQIMLFVNFFLILYITIYQHYIGNLQESGVLIDSSLVPP